MDKLGARMGMRHDMLAIRMIARQRGDVARRVLAILKTSHIVHNTTNIVIIYGERQPGTL